MPCRCLIKNCDRQNKNVQNRSLFQFPKKDLIKRKLWFSAIPKSVCRKFTETGRICSLHFLKKFLKPYRSGQFLEGRFRLTSNAVPSLNFGIEEDDAVSNNYSYAASYTETDTENNIESLAVKKEMICRACLCDDVELLKSFLEEPTLLDMYTDCTFLQVEIGDGLPMNLCTACISKCTDWIAFKQVCEQNDSQLRSQLTTNQIVYAEMSETIPNVDFDEMKIRKIDSPSQSTETLTTSIDNLDSKLTIKKDMLFEEVDVKTEFIDIDIEDSTMNGNSISALISSSPTKVNIAANLEPVEPDKSKRRYICGVCYELFTSLLQLKNHTKIHKCSTNENQEAFIERPFKCDVCNKDFTTLSSLRSHIYNLHSDPRFSCKLCPKKFYIQSALILHTKRHTGEKPFECKVCHKFFLTKNYVDDHQRCHSDKRKYLCSICGKAYKKNSNFKDHMAVAHAKSLDFTCEICNRSFPIKGLLTNHLESHSTKRPYKCLNCGKGFKTEQQFRKHAKKPENCAENKRKYICGHCGVEFVNQKELIFDLKSHKVRGLIPCRFCDKSYKHNQDLIVHLRHHTGERPFACNLCSESFASSKMLKHHNNTKHVIKND